jgi:hypothetical protein
MDNIVRVQLLFNPNNPIDRDILALLKAGDVTKDGRYSGTAVKQYLYKSLHNKENWRVMKTAKPVIGQLPY